MNNNNLLATLHEPWSRFIARSVLQQGYIHLVICNPNATWGYLTWRWHESGASDGELPWKDQAQLISLVNCLADGYENKRTNEWEMGEPC